MTIVTYVDKPNRARRRKRPVVIPMRIVTAKKPSRRQHLWPSARRSLSASRRRRRPSEGHAKPARSRWCKSTTVKVAIHIDPEPCVVNVVWERMAKLADEFLPKPRVLHPWPSVRFTVRHPEVGAVCGNSARTDLCGGDQQWASLPRTMSQPVARATDFRPVPARCAGPHINRVGNLP